MTEGIILKGIGGFYYVDTPEGLIECKARGKFRKTVGKPIVGDRVQLEVQPDGTGYLMSIAPRRNSLIRPAVANLDLVVAVASAAPPVTDPFLIDKVTAIAVHKEITPLVVINKTDADAGDELYETYRKSGIEVLRVSARTGDGIDALRERICGKVSAFAGNSGVGKSSVLNALDPALALPVGILMASAVPPLFEVRTETFLITPIAGVANIHEGLCGIAVYTATATPVQGIIIPTTRIEGILNIIIPITGRTRSIL